MKEKIAKWYKQGLWTKTMVKNAVKKGVLTAGGPLSRRGGKSAPSVSGSGPGFNCTMPSRT